MKPIFSWETTKPLRIASRVADGTNAWWWLSLLFHFQGEIVNVTRVMHPVRSASVLTHRIVLLVSKVQIFTLVGDDIWFDHNPRALCVWVCGCVGVWVCVCVCVLGIFTGYFLDQDSSCVAQCPSGSYANSATQLCEDCSPNCEACIDTSDNCVSCAKGSYRLFLHQGRCWSNCPE